MAALALILGIIAVLVSFGTDTAPNGTHNLGLLQQQMMALHVGLALLIVSAIRWDAQPLKRPTRPAPTATVEGGVLTIDPNIERDNKRWSYGMLTVLAAIIVLALISSRG